MTPNEESLVTQMWKDDLKVSDIGSESLCDIRNVLIIAAGILNLHVTVIKSISQSFPNQSIDAREGRNSVRPKLDLNFIEA